MAMDESVMQSAYDKAWVIKLEAEAQRKRQELEAQKRLQNAGACTVGQSDEVDFTKILTDIFELMDKNADGYIDMMEMRVFSRGWRWGKRRRQPANRGNA